MNKATAAAAWLPIAASATAEVEDIPQMREPDPPPTPPYRSIFDPDPVEASAACALPALKCQTTVLGKDWQADQPYDWRFQLPFGLLEASKIRPPSTADPPAGSSRESAKDAPKSHPARGGL